MSAFDPSDDARDAVPDRGPLEPAVDAAPDLPAEDAVAAGSTSTGHPAVDEVLRSLEDLESRPVDEHVGVFEQAHESLREALSSAGDDQD